MYNYAFVLFDIKSTKIRRTSKNLYQGRLTFKKGKTFYKIIKWKLPKIEIVILKTERLGKGCL